MRQRGGNEKKSPSKKQKRVRHLRYHYLRMILLYFFGLSSNSVGCFLGRWRSSKKCQGASWCSAGSASHVPPHVCCPRPFRCPPSLPSPSFWTPIRRHDRHLFLCFQIRAWPRYHESFMYIMQFMQIVLQVESPLQSTTPQPATHPSCRWVHPIAHAARPGNTVKIPQKWDLSIYLFFNHVLQILRWPYRPYNVHHNSFTVFSSKKCPTFLGSLAPSWHRSPPCHWNAAWSSPTSPPGANSMAC